MEFSTSRDIEVIQAHHHIFLLDYSHSGLQGFIELILPFDLFFVSRGVGHSYGQRVIGMSKSGINESIVDGVNLQHVC